MKNAPPGEFLFRHLPALLERRGLSEALQRLGEQAPEPDRRVAQRAQQALRRGASAGEALREGLGRRAGQLPELLVAAESHGGDGLKALRGYLASTHLWRAPAASVGRAGREGLFLIGSTLAVAAICAAILSIFVLPAFADFFGETGTELPSLTATVLAWSDLALPILLVAAPITIFALQFGLRRLHSALAEGRPLTSSVPGALGAIRAHRRLMAMAYLRAFLQAGLSLDKALAVAERLAATALPADDREGLIAAAALGGLERELDWRLASASEDALEAARKLERELAVVLQVAVAVVVGILVVAVYLPIFKLGAAV